MEHYRDRRYSIERPSTKSTRSSSARRVPIVHRPRGGEQRARSSTPDRLDVRSHRRLADRAKTRGLRRLRTQQRKERLSHKHRRRLSRITPPCTGISRPKSDTSRGNRLPRSDEGMGPTRGLEIPRTREESAYRRAVPIQEL